MKLYGCCDSTDRFAELWQNHIKQRRNTYQAIISAIRFLLTFYINDCKMSSNSILKMEALLPNESGAWIPLGKSQKEVRGYDMDLGTA